MKGMGKYASVTITIFATHIKSKILCLFKLEPHGTDTDTDTNVYTIVYHVQYTYTCTRAHPQRTSSRGKARVLDKSPRTSRRGSSCVSGSWRPERAACAAASQLPCVPRHAAPTSARAGHANFRTRILMRKSARKSVLMSVSVFVPWNLSFTANKIKHHQYTNNQQTKYKLRI